MTLAGYPAHDLAWLAGLLLAAGALTGLLSGMLGVGGGGVLVPVLYETFGAIGVDPALRMHMAVGTSLAVIGFTSLRSATSHARRGSVDLAVVRRLGPWVVLGVIAGVLLARNAPASTLKWAWVVFGTVMATKLGFGRDDWRFGDTLPGSWLVELYALCVGFISVLLSIAGAAYTVTLLTLYGRPMVQAVGTSSAFGPLIAIPGLAGFIWAGWSVAGTPPFSLGYTNLLAAALILPTSLAVAPFGVAIAHGVSRRTLEIAFAVFLYLVVLRFLASLMGWTT